MSRHLSGTTNYISVNSVVITKKEYSRFPNVSLFEPHHYIKFISIHTILIEGLNLLQKWRLWILLHKMTVWRKNKEFQLPYRLFFFFGWVVENEWIIHFDCMSIHLGQLYSLQFLEVMESWLLFVYIYIFA